MDIRLIGVAGAGTMGAGIAQLLAQNGRDVLLYDVSDEILDRAQRRIAVGLKRGRAPEAAARVRKTKKLEELSGCGLVLEAASEDLRLKRDLFFRLDGLLSSSGILASNTSSLSIARIAEAVKNPGRVVGMHFFNPPQVMRLVEVVRAARTSEETAARAARLARSLGKTAVVCRDTPGFVVNRIAAPFFLSAARLLEAGAGTPADIDRALREGGFPMGPLELADLIGLDVAFAAGSALHEALGKPRRLEPSRAAGLLCARGCLGRKSALGFYLHGKSPAGAGHPILGELFPRMGAAPLESAEILRQVLDAVKIEARLAAEEGVARPRDIDIAMRLGMNWPRGPFEF